MGCQLGQLVGLRVYPAQGLHLLEILMVGQHGGKVDVLMGAPLGYEHDTSDLFDLGVVWGRHSVQIATYLDTKKLVIRESKVKD